MIVYENDGHRRRMSETYHHFAWKMLEWRKDPHCRGCGKKTHIMVHEGSWKDQATVDHILSRGMGGSDTIENFQLLCGRCNNVKSKKENLAVKGRYIPAEQYNALIRKSLLLKALQREGVKNMDVWKRAQLRLKNSIDNSGSTGYNPDGVSKVESDS